MTTAISGSIAPAAAHLGDRTRRHIALRLLPFVFVLYVANYLDRTSVAYAALGMTRDLGFSDRVFGLGAGIFFVSYVALQIPGALLVELWSARRMISATMIAWGSLTALTGLVHTPAQLYLARFVLGAAEAGFFPGVIVYLSHWFRQDDRAKATSNFMSAIPISFVIGSAIAGWILGHNWLGIIGWRWLFLLEGLPAILLGVVAFFYLSDFPREAHWLAAEQREWVCLKLAEEKPVAAQGMSIGTALRSGTTLLLASVCFLDYFVLYCFMFWFPTMLKRLSGFSDVNVGLLGALPYLLAFVAMQVNGWHSDKTRERRWHAAAPFLIAAARACGTRDSDGSWRACWVDCVLAGAVHDGGSRGHCLSADLLGYPDGDFRPVGRCGGGGADQCGWQRFWLRGTLPLRLSEHAHGIAFLRTGRDVGRLACRSSADATRAQARADACQLNLRPGEPQRYG